MDTSKAAALTEWFNLFGDLVGLCHVKELGEFISGQHLTTVLTFMKEKDLPKEPSEKIVNRREFFENLLNHLANLQKVSPNKYYSELKATAASYGQSDEIAKFLIIVLYEIRMSTDLQAAAFDVILPNLSENSRNELEKLMDYLDDSSQWPSANNWSNIIRKTSSENGAGFIKTAGTCPVTPSTPKCSRMPFRELNKTVPGRPYSTYSSSNDVSVLHDSPKLRENRQRRRIQEQENEIKRLKSENNEMRHELDQVRLSKNEFKREYEQILTYNEKLLNSLREKESEKNAVHDKLEATEIKLNFMKEKNEESDKKLKDFRQLKEKIREMRAELDAAEESNMKLATKNHSQEDEILKVNSKTHQLERELMDAKEEARDAVERLSRLEQSMKERDSLVDSIKEQLENERREHENCRSKLQNLVLDNEENTRLMEDGNLELTLLKEENAKYLQRIEDLEGKLGSYILDQESTRRSTLCLENRNLQIDAAKKHLENELEKMKTRLEDYSSRAVNSESAASNLKMDLSKMEMELSTARLKMIDYDHMVTRISILETEKASSDNQLKTIQSQLEQTISRLTQRESNFLAISEQLLSAQKAMEAQTEQLRDHDELNEKIATLETNSVETSKRINDLEGELQEQKNLNEELRQEVESYHNKEEQFEKRASEFFVPPEDIFTNGRATDLFGHGQNSSHPFSETTNDLTCHHSMLPQTWNTLEPEDEDTLMEQRAIENGELQSLAVNKTHDFGVTDSSLQDNISKVSNVIGRLSFHGKPFSESSRQKSCASSVCSGTTATSDGIAEDLVISASGKLKLMKKALKNIRSSTRASKANLKLDEAP